jgi:hypothetical protein
MSVSDGYGPIVSDGVTAHAAAAVPPVVVSVVTADGLVGVSPPHPRESAALAAPITVRASRRLNFLCFIDPPRPSVTAEAGPGDDAGRTKG